ncbi:MAG: PqqD family protein [bacterium]
MKKPQEINLLELRPLRLLSWEEAGDGLVVVLKPKFENPFLKKWLLPFFKSKNFRIRLDAFGSLVFRMCDGKTSCETIAAALKEKFGDRVEPVHERLSLFVRQLENNHFIRRNFETTI